MASGGALRDVFAGAFAGARRRAPTRYAQPFIPFLLCETEHPNPNTAERLTLPAAKLLLIHSFPELFVSDLAQLRYVHVFIYTDFFAKIIGYMCTPVSNAGGPPMTGAPKCFVNLGF